MINAIESNEVVANSEVVASNVEVEAVAIDAVAEFHAALLAAFDARSAYEARKNAENDSIQSKLKAMRKALDHKRIAEIMLASNCDASRINRQERDNARYNVYAYEKDINIARTLASVASLNHYTLHILKTAKALHDAGMTLTHDDAFCACMRGSKASDTKKNKLISRYDRIEVSKGTASTQSSSSINALQSFDVLRETRNEQGVTCYVLNVEGDATKVLLNRL